MYSLDRKVVIITGASEGIGAQIASLARARGCRLFLTARNASKLSAMADPDVGFLAGDLTSAAVRARIIEAAMDRFGRIDILINNAGRGLYYSASTTPLEEARALFELNFFAPFHLAQLALPALRESRGVLVNVTSIAGQISLPWLPVYSATKFALASLSTSQRAELRREGVRVVTVFPGYVNTGFQDNATGPRPPGFVVKGKRFAISARGCAEAILKGIEHGKETIVTPRAGWALLLLNRLFPALVESRMETA